MTDTVPEIEPDMTPPARQKVGQMLGLGAKHSAEDEGPKSRPKRPPKATQSVRREEFQTLQEDLQTGYEFLGQMLAMSISPNGGAEMMARAEMCAATWVEQAKKNPRIYRFLMTATTGSGWVTILMAHAPIAMAISADMRAQAAGGEPMNMDDLVRARMDDTTPANRETVDATNGVRVV